MKRKDSSVRTNFDPLLSEFLIEVDELYREWGSELTITSGGEHDARHSYTSLHYAEPARAADLRSWPIKTRSGLNEKIDAAEQSEAIKNLAADFCARKAIPADWLEVILEKDHHHVEFQPKRRA